MRIDYKNEHLKLLRETANVLIVKRKLLLAFSKLK